MWITPPGDDSNPLLCRWLDWQLTFGPALFHFGNNECFRSGGFTADLDCMLNLGGREYDYRADGCCVLEVEGANCTIY